MALLDDVLMQDADNAGAWRLNFAKFDPGLPAAFDTASGLFVSFTRCVGDTEDESQAQEAAVLERYAQIQRLTAEEVVRHFTGSEPAVPDDVRQACLHLGRRQTAMVILLLLQRYFMWGATDLYRMRISAAEGYRRLQAEAVGLLILMQRNPQVSKDWWAVQSDGEGKKFFIKYQPDLKKILESTDLISAYNLGSGIAQHVRVASAALCISISDNRISLTYQEPLLGYGGFLAILSFLSTQVHVFHALRQAFPHITDSSWNTAVVRFIAEVQRLWRCLAESFPDEWRESELRSATVMMRTVDLMDTGGPPMEGVTVDRRGLLAGLVGLAASACGWRRMAVERHQQTQEIKRLEIERRQMELNCLKRKEADPRVDCSQFQPVVKPATAQ